MKKILLALLLLISCISRCGAQTGAETNGLIVDSTFIGSTVASLQSLIDEKYFDVAAIPRINGALRAALARGDYSRDKTVSDFASALTTTLYSASHDKHLFVTVSELSQSGSGQTQMTRADSARFSNYGMKTAKVLEGNVGYLEVTGFFRANEGSETVDAAMRFVAHTDALILDFRENVGGSPDTALQLLSYFFAQPNLPLFSIVPRSGGPLVERTLPTGIAYRDQKRPLYVLVSAQTWSAGEGVPFILQQRHRATVFGEQTAGAANPGGPSAINSVLTVNIPSGYIVSSMGKKNWEGSGIMPDVIVSPDKALQVAYVRALEDLRRSTASSPKQQMISEALAKARK